MSRFHAVVLGDAGGRGEPIAAALRDKGWRVWSRGEVPPGEDVDGHLAAALHTASLVAVLEAAALDVRDAVKAAIDLYRGDRSGRRVVPVGLAEGLPQFSGLRILQGVQLAEAPEKLDGVLRSLRADEEAVAEVLVVAHPTEVVEREALRQEVGRRRRVQHPVEVVWVDAPDVVERARRAARVVVVVGWEVAAAEVARLKAVVGLPTATVVVRAGNLTKTVRARCGDLDAVMELRGDDDGAEGHALQVAVGAVVDAWIEEEFILDGAASLQPWERLFLEQRIDEWRRGSHLALKAVAGGTGLHRAALYVPARAAEGPWRVDDSGRVELITERRKQRGTSEAPSGEERRGTAPRVWLDALLSHRELPFVVVQGEAGSGKTVLLQHVASIVAARALGLPLEEEEHLDWGVLARGAPRLRVPVLVEARRLEERLRDRPAARAVAELIAEEELSACGPARHAEVAQGFVDGRYLLLVDGRDEVPTALLESLDRALVQLVKGHPKVRVIVSTRPTAHTGREMPEPFRTVPVAPLDDEDRAALVRRWCASVPTKRQDREGALAVALGELHDRMGEVGEGDRSPLDNPLFVTCALLVYELDGQLPEGHADLYDKLVEVLCRPRGASLDQGVEQRNREVAVELARLAQARGTVGLPEREAWEGVQRARGLAGVREGERLVRAMVNHTMLWREASEGGERVVRPWHRSFQEHLAARAEMSAQRTPAQVVEALTEALHAPGWAGAVRFLPGAFVSVHSEQGSAWCEALAAAARAEADPRRRGHLWALVADAVAEERVRCFQGRNQGRGAAALAEEVARVYGDEGEGWGWEDRRLLLEGLGRMATRAELGWGGSADEAAWLVDPRLADPRARADRWVAVEGGRYRIGGDKLGVQSGAGRRVEVPPFWLLDTPVTVQDYRPFVAQGGPAPAWWAAQRRCPGRPVVGVTWHDAVAFCLWATGAWRAPEAGARVALPTAAMWEAAARGRGGDGYPWGDAAPGAGDAARAAHDWNPTGAGPLRSATPVGAFPGGRRGRLGDLAGNVWEWTASRWSADGSVDDEGLSDVDTSLSSPDASSRVVRGGSWVLHPSYLRAAYRSRNFPGDRDDDLGFRVCAVREPGR